MDNFIGKEPRKIADIPVLMAGDAKAREFRWSKVDEEKIEAKEQELLDALTAAAKQQKDRKRKKTFKQKQEEAIAAALASDSSSADESDPPTPPPTKKRKTDRKAKDGKKASKAKK